MTLKTPLLLNILILFYITSHEVWFLSTLHFIQHIIRFMYCILHKNGYRYPEWWQCVSGCTGAIGDGQSNAEMPRWEHRVSAWDVLTAWCDAKEITLEDSSFSIKTLSMFCDALGPGSNFNSTIFKSIIQNISLGIGHEIAFRWMSQYPSNTRPILFQAMD